jgi:hypothetical protein
MHSTGETDDTTDTDRAAGALLLAGSLATLVLMTQHPTISSHEIGPVLEQLAAIAGRNRLVHGAIIASSVLAAIGFSGLAARLGWRSLAVRAGALAWLLGLIAFAGAAIVNGFVITSLAEDYTGKAAATQDTLKPLFRLCHHANQTLAQAGTLAASVAILAWSLALWRGGSRGLGIFGIVVGLLPIVGLVSGRLSLDLHGMLAVVLAETAWSTAVAVALLRGGPRLE